jgi:putative addiction module component (TIGR02574 family)
MSLETKSLFLAALSLPLRERAALAEVVVDSLPAENRAVIDQAWRIEIRRRLDAYERGEDKATEAENVFAKYEQPGVRDVESE